MLERCVGHNDVSVVLCFVHLRFSGWSCGIVPDFGAGGGGFEWPETEFFLACLITLLIGSTTDTYHASMLIFNVQGWAVLILTGLSVSINTDRIVGQY